MSLTERERRNIATIQRRLGDYSREDFLELRHRLVERWQAAYPDAVNEVSWNRPLVQLPLAPKQTPDEPDENWTNDIYFVVVRRHKVDPVFRNKKGMVQLGISSHDGTARHDWRDFQAIKNQLAGAECEAFELYPAESRLLDPSNYFTLWCFPGIRRIHVGADGERDVRDKDEALAPQRGFGVTNG